MHTTTIIEAEVFCAHCGASILNADGYDVISGPGGWRAHLCSVACLRAWAHDQLSQPALPGAEHVRTQNISTPEFAMPFSLVSEPAPTTEAQGSFLDYTDPRVKP